MLFVEVCRPQYDLVTDSGATGTVVIPGMLGGRPPVSADLLVVLVGREEVVEFGLKRVRAVDELFVLVALS